MPMLGVIELVETNRTEVPSIASFEGHPEHAERAAQPNCIGHVLYTSVQDECESCFTHHFFFSC